MISQSMTLCRMITDMDMSIEANDDITSIDDVTNASIKFEVRDYDSYETFYSSDELTFISNN